MKEFTTSVSARYSYKTKLDRLLLGIGVNALQTLGVLPSPFPPPSSVPFTTLLPLIQLRVWGSAVCSPSRSGWSLATKRILVHLQVKMKRFRGQISCVFNNQNLKGTAIDLFCDSTNYKINYADENGASYA